MLPIFVSKICVVSTTWLNANRRDPDDQMSLISNLFSIINRQQFSGQHVMNQNGGGRRIEKRDQQQSQRSHQVRPIVSHQSLSPNKRIKLVNGNLLPSDDVLVPNMRVWKFYIDPKSLTSLLLKKLFCTLIRLKNQKKLITENSLRS